MRISPVNVSVHTMNESLRVKMMKNKNAGKVLKYLDKLSQNGIEINAQLVLCPNINDGDELIYSLSELYKLPTLNSVAAVPVGLTKHREGLCNLTPFDKESSRKVIEILNKFGETAKKEKGIRTFYASDEFYLKADIPIPDDQYYEDYPQIENGVGMLRDHRECFDYALKKAKKQNRAYFGKKKTVATGVAAYPHICSLVKDFINAYPTAEINVSRIENNFFGKSVTVSGLLTGGDIAAQVEDVGEILLLPENVLKHDEDIFLDNMTLTELKERLKIDEIYMAGDGEDFLEALFK
jgi:putative radical SAM enzyme (TIGR03279 family)